MAFREYTALAGACLLLCASVAPAAATPRLTPTPDGVRWSGAALAGVARTSARIAAWRAALDDTGVVGAAVRIALADTLAARGDTLGAESLLDDTRLAHSLWGLDALIRRAGYRAAHGDTAGAARLLEQRDERDWRTAELATWEARLATFRAALRDTARAEHLALSAVDRSAVNPSAGKEAFQTLERITTAKTGERRRSLELATVTADWYGGKRAEAIERARAVARRSRGTADEWRDVYWVLQLCRDARKPRLALVFADAVGRRAATAEQRERLQMARARAYRDLGRPDSALKLFGRLSSSASDTQRRMLAAWEGAREAQDRSRWRGAARAFDLADSLRSRVPDGVPAQVHEARSLAGLMYWLLGDTRRAEQRWRSRGDERSRFWLAILLRRRGVAEGDSILRTEFAEQAGFGLYRVAARETLGVRGWSGEALAFAPDTVAPRFAEAVVRLAGPLALSEAAARLVSARDRRDPRVPGDNRGGIAASTWHAITAASYVGGDVAGATRAADRALQSLGRDSLAWDMVPWAFPPAYETEVKLAAREFGIERSLLWAFTRQESRFDARAVSRSNARGLTQLLPGTARDMAKALREPFPADTVVFEPARALRYGARYMRWLLDRFDGHVAVALTGYNAGAGKVRPDWRELIARGGDMLYVELAANADTQDYVRRILGYRQAYRELRPFTATTP